MEIGIDENFDDDFIEDVHEETQENATLQDNSSLEPEEDFLTTLLKSRGIDDKSRIKFEDEDGLVEEKSWDDLSNEDRLNILNTSSDQADNGLQEDELQLINAIRQSNLTPAEYMQKVSTESVDRYLQNNSQPQYTVDQYSDDELFIADLLSRMGDITDDEAREALEHAKSNESLFAKQIDAIRKEYQQIETENAQQAQLEQEQQQQARFQLFSDSVVSEINNLQEISGYELNMANEDMQELYDFVAGVDNAGVNPFSKAMSDPKTLVQTAWFALNGQRMIQDITNYFQKEITKVRKESYNKGLADAKVDKTSSVYKPSSMKKGDDIYNDLDDF